jgi:hypothetical protein
LTANRILAWADAHHAQTGRWPTAASGPVEGAPGETWNALNLALRDGHRGLRRGDSLARLLERGRGKRNPAHLAPLAVKDILTWADAHRSRTGEWPKCNGGPVADRPAESWPNIDAALRQGFRGHPGGDSLPRLLARRRGVRNRGGLPRLTKVQVLTWAREHRRRKGKWPTVLAGPIPGAKGETWWSVDRALRDGLRGLPGGDSLPQLLRRARGR